MRRASASGNSRKQAIDEFGTVVQIKSSDELSCVDDILMSRFVRHLLFASVLACHAAVTLCGPCLHALPGSSHEPGAASSSHRPDGPPQSRGDAGDNCLICQFVAQGQLPVEFCFGPSLELVSEPIVPAVPASHTLPLQLPSSPRAPPMVADILS
jgi:hypothetical protein